MREDELRPVWTSRPSVHITKLECVFITAVPITKLFAWGETKVDSGGHVL
jgi:hypothetical protein